ncbi:MAG TPA: thioesterase [Bacteroidales bacterium]|nr:thioesterase [Bacteroidales bacterium]
MLVGTTTLRVTYADTDQMGFVYYGNYPKYYEIGRTELMRSLGFPYKELENLGVMMPVINLQSNYKAPGKYDDLLTIKTIVKELPSVKMHFIYEIYNPNEKLINIGETTLVFVNMKTNRPVRVPEVLLNVLLNNFEH